MRLIENGYYNVVRNDVVLIHHESISRGNDILDEKKMQALIESREYLYQKHPQYKNTDPFYNKNLAQYTNDFSIDYNNELELNVEHLADNTWQQLPCSDAWHGDIDILNGENGVFVEGWSLLTNKPDNNEAKVEVVLSSLEGAVAYKICAMHVLRVDVAKGFMDLRNVEKVGFKAKTAKGRIPSARYRVHIMMDGFCMDTEKKIEVLS